MTTLTTNLPTTNIEDTVKHFATLYDQPIQVGQQTMDIVYSFFIKRAANEEAALAVVHSVIITALEHKVDPLEVIEEFKKYDDLQLSQRMATFMNMSRNNTSILGIGAAPTVNYHIARTLLP